LNKPIQEENESSSEDEKIADIPEQAVVSSSADPKTMYEQHEWMYREEQHIP